MIAKAHMGHWYKVTDLGVELNSWLEVCSFTKWILIYFIIWLLICCQTSWFSGKSCAVTIPRTIPYVEINSTTKFALDCNEGLIMTLNSNMQASVTALWYKMCTMYLGFFDKHGFTYLWIYFFLHIVNTFSVTFY